MLNSIKLYIVYHLPRFALKYVANIPNNPKYIKYPSSTPLITRNKNKKYTPGSSNTILLSTLNNIGIRKYRSIGIIWYT